jgi:hypothetical protein
MVAFPTPRRAGLELALLDLLRQLDSAYRDSRIVESREPEHRPDPPVSLVGGPVRLGCSSIVLACFQRIASAAFSAPFLICSYQVRDQEVGGSNPLAPTNLCHQFPRHLDRKTRF